MDTIVNAYARSFKMERPAAYAALALCTLGFDRVRVQLFADPAVDRNVHEIEASGLGGSFFARIANAPSVDNPKTSLITPYSVLRTLEARQSRLSI